MSKIENAVAFAENAARDDSHGYDQIHRWGDPDYDCSGLVITACEQAGIPLKANGATYTGNIYQPALKSGFKNVTSSVNLTTGAGLKRGDIMLKPNGHAAFYCGNGKMVDARINEKGTITGGKSGDQTGKEIMIHAYKNHPFTIVLRYEETSSGSNITAKPSVASTASNVVAGKYGNGQDRIDKLKSLGYTDAEIKEIQAKVNEMVSASKKTTTTTAKPAAQTTSPAAHFKVGSTYTTKVSDLNVRTGPGTSYSRKSRTELTSDGRKHADSEGQLKSGTRVTCKAVKTVGSQVWIQTPSGWLCAYNGSKYYVK